MAEQDATQVERDAADALAHEAEEVCRLILGAHVEPSIRRERARALLAKVTTYRESKARRVVAQADEIERPACERCRMGRSTGVVVDALGVSTSLCGACRDEVASP